MIVYPKDLGSYSICPIYRFPLGTLVWKGAQILLSLDTLTLKTPLMGRFCRFCQPEKPLGALNCRQVGRISTICTGFVPATYLGPLPHNPDLLILST